MELWNKNTGAFADETLWANGFRLANGDLLSAPGVPSAEQLAAVGWIPVAAVDAVPDGYRCDGWYGSEMVDERGAPAGTAHKIAAVLVNIAEEALAKDGARWRDENRFLQICDELSGRTDKQKLDDTQIESAIRNMKLTDRNRATDLAEELLSIQSRLATRYTPAWWFTCVWHPEVAE